jgi:hypothetical protein
MGGTRSAERERNPAKKALTRTARTGRAGRMRGLGIVREKLFTTKVHEGKAHERLQKGRTRSAGGRRQGGYRHAIVIAHMFWIGKGEI